MAGLVTATACSKKETAAPTPVPAPLTVSGSLTGRQEVPAVPTSATGTLTGTYDKTTMVLKYAVTYSGITPTIGHFHIGAPGVKGPVSLAFKYNDAAGTGFVSPITGTETLTSDQATALLGNAFYANLHSAANPGGEIRADLTAK
ncbi:MAG: CHRD domain-containing protein [Hymenobacter sp.]